MDTHTILGLFSFFRDLPPTTQDDILAHAECAALPAGAFYFHAGELCRGVALLGRGNVRVFKTGETGREITLYHVGPGESCLLTLNSALTGDPYPADGLVEEDVEAVLLPAEKFAAWVDREPRLRRHAFSAMAQRLADLMALIDEVAFRRLDRRLASFLLQEFDSAQRSDRILHTTHEHIAAELGSAREVISRLLKDFERKGILRLARSKVEMLDDAALREVLTQD